MDADQMSSDGGEVTGDGPPVQFVARALFIHGLEQARSGVAVHLDCQPDDRFGQSLREQHNHRLVGPTVALGAFSVVKYKALFALAVGQQPKHRPSLARTAAGAVKSAGNRAGLRV